MECKDKPWVVDNDAARSIAATTIFEITQIDHTLEAYERAHELGSRSRKQACLLCLRKSGIIVDKIESIRSENTFRDPGALLF